MSDENTFEEWYENQKSWQKGGTGYCEKISWERFDQFYKIMGQFKKDMIIPFSFFNEKSRNRNSEIYPVFLAYQKGVLILTEKGLILRED